MVRDRVSRSISTGDVIYMYFTRHEEIHNAASKRCKIYGGCYWDPQGEIPLQYPVSYNSPLFVGFVIPIEVSSITVSHDHCRPVAEELQARETLMDCSSFCIWCDVDTYNVEASFHMYLKYLRALRRILGQNTSLETRTTEENYAPMSATALWCFQGQEVMRKANVDFISRAKPSLNRHRMSIPNTFHALWTAASLPARPFTLNVAILISFSLPSSDDCY